MTEAFSKGTPVIASGIGSMTEAVRQEENGVLFEVGDAEDLAVVLGQFPSPGAELDRLRAGSRACYERLYSSDVVYAKLMDIYSDAIREVRKTV